MTMPGESSSVSCAGRRRVPFSIGAALRVIGDGHGGRRYLHADGAAPPAAVWTFQHQDRTTAQRIEAQDASHAVADHTHLQKDGRGGRATRLQLFFLKKQNKTLFFSQEKQITEQNV